MSAQQAFDWSHLRVFLSVAEGGSYSAAARALGLAQPTVGRQIAALEGELGVALFERSGRGLALTPTGLELVEHARTMADAALRVSRVAAGQALSLEGQVRITASEVVGAWLLPPVVRVLRERFPTIELELVASNASQDLRRREADLALRNFRPTDPELVARKLRDDEVHLYATPGYLASLGRRVTKDALGRATFIGFDPSDTFRKGLEAALGLSLGAANFPILSANQHVQWALVKQGLGIGVMMAVVGDAERAVRRISRELPPIVIPTWLVTHREVNTSRRVRAVADVLAEQLGSRSLR